ncbi:MAG: hypothetical protein K0V04_25270 [Deltaproteobacteria bacterium]|nr:hypothetical protein [Deltaproteobacteria bacterium]
MSELLNIQMPLGLPGVTDLAGFSLERRAQGSAYAWLRSTDAPDIELLLVDVIRQAPD